MDKTKLYLSVFFKLVYNFFKLIIIKIISLNGISFHPLQLLSFGTKLKISKKGKIIFNGRISSRSGVCIYSSGGVVQITHSFFNHNCIITGMSRIEIGDGCIFGPNVQVFDHDHVFGKNGVVPNKYNIEPITIGKNVWVGANAIILRGSKIGDNSVIGAGCIIRGEIPRNSRVIQRRELQIDPLRD